MSRKVTVVSLRQVFLADFNDPEATLSDLCAMITESMNTQIEMKMIDE